MTIDGEMKIKNEYKKVQGRLYGDLELIEMPEKGIEPPTSSLQNWRSTIELHRLNNLVFNSAEIDNDTDLRFIRQVKKINSLSSPFA